jgi:lipoprotein-anchoring transpeptidase ErfK/SrfK
MKKQVQLSLQHNLTRRAFLKFGGASLFGLLLPYIPTWHAERTPDLNIRENLRRTLPEQSEGLAEPTFSLNPTHAWVSGAGRWQMLNTEQDNYPQQGRVLEGFAALYEQPSFDANRVKFVWKDAVLSINDAVFREDTDSHNRVWYKIGEEGYVHSGSIQPVRTQLNEVNTGLPESGALAELTVPFSDAHWNPGSDDYIAYRFYYATTHWVSHVKYDNQGQAWYAVLDDKWEYIYYVQASHLRILPQEELTTLSPEVPAGFKRLEVHIPEQVVIAYEMDKPVFMARVASGAKFRNGDFSTRPGNFMTFHKRPTRHMAAGNLAANGYDLPGVPWICYFTESGISFHGTYWHNNFGHPRSHGCINLTPQAARWIYRWTMPVVPPGAIMTYERYGTPINVIDQETWEPG